MVLYMIGLGLGDAEDITVKGLNIIRSADLVFLESYTSIFLNVPIEELETLYQKKIILADRELCENDADIKIIEPARTLTVVFLVVGDPVCATTHTDLWLRCQQKQIDLKIIHNASIMNAVGSTGLQLYQFGQTISIPFFTETWQPTSFYEKIQYNRLGQLHTLCLLDIKVKEPDYDAIIKHGGSTIRYLPPRYMTVQQAAEQLITTESLCKGNAYDINQTLCIGVARLGHCTNQKIIAGTLNELKLYEGMGEPLHSLIICADELHDLEYDLIQYYLIKDTNYKRHNNNNVTSSTTSPPPTTALEACKMDDTVVEEE